MLQAIGEGDRFAHVVPVGRGSASRLALSTEDREEQELYRGLVERRAAEAEAKRNALQGTLQGQQ